MSDVHGTGVWVGLGAVMDDKENLVPSGIQSQENTSSSEPLNRLRYPVGHFEIKLSKIYIIIIIIIIIITLTLSQNAHQFCKRNLR